MKNLQIYVSFQNMFYESAELDQNYVTLETVKLELFAGGMSVQEERQISEKLVNKENHQVKLPLCFNWNLFVSEAVLF